MECYLDNAATTQPFQKVKDVMNQVLQEDYGNPSSMHQKGVDAEKYIKDARQVIAKSLRVTEKEIIFTSGGTESNNMAIIGTALANQRAGKHMITTGMEHASVYNPFLFLEELGYEVTYLGVDAMGHVDLKELEQAVREDTILVSIMFVNNEIGAVADMEAISQTIRKKNPKTLLHADAIQAYGKLTIYPKKLGIDLLSVSGHKIHGPKGSGFIYIRDKVKIKPIIYGGEQQRGMRSGTENVPAIAGLGVSVTEYQKDHKDKIRDMYVKKAHFILKALKIEKVRVHGVGEPDEIQKLYDELCCRDNPENHAAYTAFKDAEYDWQEEALRVLQAPHIVSVSFPGVRSEVMLHALEDKGIYVSAGSACSSNHPGISGTLKAIGLDEKELTSTLRFSFSLTTTTEQIDYALDAAAKLYPMLARYTRK